MLCSNSKLYSAEESDWKGYITDFLDSDLWPKVDHVIIYIVVFVLLTAIFGLHFCIILIY